MDSPFDRLRVSGRFGFPKGKGHDDTRAVGWEKITKRGGVEIVHGIY